MRGPLLFEWLIVVASWLGLGLQFYLLLHNAPANDMTYLAAAWRFLAYFTILSNLLVAISVSGIAALPHSAMAAFFQNSSIAGALAVYIFVVGLVYNTILRHTWQPQGAQKLADELLHVAVPVLYLVYWLAWMNKANLRWKHAFQWLVFPACYLLYVMLRGVAEGFYPYPFIDAGQLSIERTVLNVLGLMLVFVVIGLIFISIARRLDNSAGNK